MCIIVYSPPGVGASMDMLHNCWERNSDGAGVMYAEDGQLKIAKGFMKWRSLKRYIKRLGTDKIERLPFAFHFRIATHGSVSARNCHPFTVHKDMAMVHNGIMSNIPIEKDNDISDSEAFLELYVRGLGPELGMKDKITIEQLEYASPLNDLFTKFVGGSKLLFMDGNGDVAIVNEDLGYWEKKGLDEGAWFSNRLWKPFEPKATVVHNKYQYPGYNHYGKTEHVHSKPKMRVWSSSKPVDKPAHKSLAEGQRALVDFDDPDEEWYCIDCQCYFTYGMSRRVYWVYGNERIIECPECESANTHEVNDLLTQWEHDEDFDIEGGDDAN